MTLTYRKYTIPLLAVSILFTGGLVNPQAASAQLPEDMSILLPEPTAIAIDDPIIQEIIDAFQQIEDAFIVVGDAISANTAEIESLKQKQHLADLNCSTDQIAKFDGINWICSQDEIADADIDSTNELQTITLNGDVLTLSDNGGTVFIPTGGPTDVFWNDIIGIPPAIADGDADSQLSEAQVDNFVANNGFLTSIPNPNWNQIQGIPNDIANGDDVGLTSVSWNQIQSIPSGFADGVDNVSMGIDSFRVTCSNSGGGGFADVSCTLQCPATYGVTSIVDGTGDHTFLSPNQVQCSNSINVSCSANCVK